LNNLINLYKLNKNIGKLDRLESFHHRKNYLNKDILVKHLY